MNSLHDLGYEPGDLEVRVSELLVATSDASDAAIDQSVPEVLRLLRDRMKMDVVFVSEFFDGKRVIKHVANTPGKDVIAVGTCEPLEDTWCQRVVDGRLPAYIEDTARLPAAAELLEKLPFPVGTFISTPIVLKSGEVYGTLCALSFAPHDQPNRSDLKNLQFTAQLAAQKIDKQRVVGAAKPPTPEQTLAPK